MHYDSFISRFQQIVAAYSNHLAIYVNPETQLTYAELYEQALQLAQTLKKYGIGAGHLIGIHLNKSADYIIALLATWMTDAAFTPIDPCLPKARQNNYITQTKPNLIIRQNLAIEFYHHELQYPSNLAYILFTSGSTGQPKGVMIPHQGIVNFIEQQIDVFQLDSSSRVLWYLSIQFDASISDIGTTLLSGGTLYLLEHDTLDLTLQLLSILEKYQITHIDIPPSLLSTLDIQQAPTTLKTIIIGGETCAIETVRQWAKKYRLINVYGPTESTVCTSMALCTEQFAYASIGKPIKNVNYLISQGELYISGVGLALGYLNNKELSQFKFVTINDEIYYRTGDLVKQNEDGGYVYLGRVDRQEKIRGRLVEPDEIEAALYQHPSVTVAAVVINQRKQILALVTTKKSTTPLLLNYFLQSLLPSWMIPNRILIVNNIPKNPHGKIDYTSIKTMDFNSIKVPLPQTAIKPIENQLQHLFKDVLKLSFFPDIHDDFFSTLGITSLDILNIAVRLESAGFPVSIELLKHFPTIYDLSTWLEQNQTIFADALPTFLLKKEAGAMQNHPIAKSNSKHILLTGATGFLGIHLLQELLQTTPSDIICLIRANTLSEALEKINRVAQMYAITITPYLHRIQFILGDIALPQLGLSTTDWQYLCNNIGHIIHSAAEVNMTKTFAELKSVNLEGTKEIAKLAMTAHKKHLSYISTLSVFVATDRNTGLCEEDDKLDKTQYVYGGYAQSKWAADYFLSHSELDVSIFRLGLITGHSIHGYCSRNDFLALFIKELKKNSRQITTEYASCLKSLEHLYVDATPVDYAARAIIHLSLNAPAKCYHIANQRGFSLPMIMTALHQHNTQIKHVIPNAVRDLLPFKRCLAHLALCRLFSHQENAFTRFRAMDLFQATNVEFAQKNTLQYLATSRIHCPNADEKLLDKYMQWILNAS